MISQPNEWLAQAGLADLQRLKYSGQDRDMPAGCIDFHGLPAWRLAGQGGTAVVACHGAQVLSWRPAGAGEHLYLSDLSDVGPEASIRGGVPVIFPQFADTGPLLRHGFARRLPWELCDIDDGAATRCVFRLAHSPATLAGWPHRFLAELRVTVDGAVLDLQLVISNTGNTSFGFSAALHTYLAVDAIDAVRLEGLENSPYQEGGAEHPAAHGPLTIAGLVDRIYPRPGKTQRLCEGESELLIQRDGFDNVVVWNPGEDLPDMAAGDHPRMLCVEAAQVLQPVQLAPGASWTGRQTLTARSVDPA